MAKVTLGGVEFTVEPLTLGQLRAIGIGGAKMRPEAGTTNADREAAWYDGTFDVLAAALKKKREEIEAIPGATLEELIAANKVVFEVCGLTKKEEPKGPKPPGEDQPAAGG